LRLKVSIRTRPDWAAIGINLRWRWQQAGTTFDEGGSKWEQPSMKVAVSGNNLRWRWTLI